MHNSPGVTGEHGEDGLLWFRFQLCAWESGCWELQVQQNAAASRQVLLEGREIMFSLFKIIGGTRARVGGQCL